MGQMTATLTHEWIWRAIDLLASRHGLTPSGLARKADLDATTFNPSKRFTPEGRPRWPSTESIAKILAATGTSLDEFVELQSEAQAPASLPEPPLEATPVVGEIRKAAVTGLATDQLPEWTLAQGGSSGRRFALSIKDASLEPLYSRGNTLILSTVEAVEPGDRVVIKPQGLQPMPRLILRNNSRGMELGTFRPEGPRERLEHKSVDWIARIMWVRQ